MVEIPEIINGDFQVLDDTLFRNIFPHQIDYDKITGDSVYLQKEVLNKYAEKDKIKENESIWKLSTYWTTKTIENIYDSLSKDLKIEFLKLLDLDMKINYIEFSYFLEIFNKVRNRVCHLNSIYDINFKSRKAIYTNKKNVFNKYILNMIKKLYKPKEKIKKIRLYQILQIINIIHKNDLIEKINNLISDLSKTINKKSFNRIKGFMGFS